jgi:hypothetical protein
MRIDVVSLDGKNTPRSCERSASFSGTWGGDCPQDIGALYFAAGLEISQILKNLANVLVEEDMHSLHGRESFHVSI